MHRPVAMTLIVLLLMALAGCAGIYLTPESQRRGERRQILASHPEWPPDIVGLIQDDVVQQGMTAEQVRAAWGPPTRVSAYTGGLEIWLFDRGNWRWQTVTLRNRRVTSISTHE